MHNFHNMEIGILRFKTTTSEHNYLKYASLMNVHANIAYSEVKKRPHLQLEFANPLNLVLLQSAQRDRAVEVELLEQAAQLLEDSHARGEDVVLLPRSLRAKERACEQVFEKFS